MRVVKTKRLTQQTAARSPAFFGFRQLLTSALSLSYRIPSMKAYLTVNSLVSALVLSNWDNTERQTGICRMILICLSAVLTGHMFRQNTKENTPLSSGPSRCDKCNQ